MKQTKLVELAKQFDESVKRFGVILQQIKEPNKKYEYYFYAKEIHVLQKQTIE